MRNFLTGLVGGAFFWYLVVLLSLGVWLGKFGWVSTLVPPLALLTGLIAWRRPGVLNLLIPGSLAGIVACILVPGFLRARHQGRMVACKSNLKAIARALETCYEHELHYPANLDALTPRYLVALPCCPAAQKSTYGLGYHRSHDGSAYTVWCEGQSHAYPGLPGPSGHPVWTSAEGLVEVTP